MPCNNNRGCVCLSDPTSPPEKICIRTQRVFDACMNRITQENANLNVNFPSTPVKFVDGRSVSSGVVSDVIITPQPCNPCSRVQYSVDIPMEIEAYDLNGEIITGTTQLSINRDILLKVPREAMIPTEVQITASVRCVRGNLAGNVLTTTYCATIITKIVAEVELLVQSYGYPALPNCQEFSEEICTGVFTMPIYPR